MPNFRITLVQNLPNRAPSRFQARFTYRDGTSNTWWLEHVHPDRDVATITAWCNADLVNQPNVATRELISHYPDDPNTVTTQISSVMPANVALGATNYGIDITMDQATVTGLVNGGFYLYAFKGVQTTIKGGAPVVWFQSQTFSLNTAVSWTEQYQAYTSKSAIIPNGSIIASAAYDIDLQQTLNVTSSAGTGAVVQGGTVGAISINNETSTQFTSGISQVIAGRPSSLCAFPQYGGNVNVMAPIQKVLLMFSTHPVNTGTVIYQSYSRGILIDLTGVTSRTVSYDINTGWSWGGGAWARQEPANTDLVPLLIEPSASLERAALRGVSELRSLL